MAENYTVNYNINVNSKRAAEALNAFQTAVSGLMSAQQQLTAFQRTIDTTFAKLSELSKRKPIAIDFNTSKATGKLEAVLRLLTQIETKAKQLQTIGVGTGVIKNSNNGAVANGGTAAQQIKKRNTSNRSGGSARAIAVPTSKNIGYKVFGPTPLPSNGGMAVDMLKGMGIAYGISGIGQAVSSIVKQSSEYDNLMATAKNILKSHDDKENFSGRFQSMSRTVRNVGMETKFTVAEVADAAKFLAMAGLDLEAIQQSIRPIADIALIGDTNIGETADLVTNIMTAYNIEPRQMRKAADVMANTFTMSNTTLTEIAESYKYAASLLSAGGIGFEEATAAIGVLGDAGIKGSQAGTTLRTIMANLANPTKKQRAAWNSLGINRLDKNGNVRPLIEIFKELNEKNLDIGSYYRLFHKTAATGAVALTDHIDKWNRIYLENFVSGGLSAKLADEKKNTVQGLWAQVESTFMDTGLMAFQSVEGGLRGLMNQAIGWLKSDEAVTMFKEVSNAIMEFVQTIIAATRWFKAFFDIFGSSIKMWVKFSLMVWPVVKAIQALKSAWLGLQGLRAFSLGIVGVIGNLEKYARAANIAAIRTRKLKAEAADLPAPTGGGGRFVRNWRRGVSLGRGAVAAYGMPVAKMGVGALAGYGAIAAVTQDDANSYDYATGGLLGAAGMAAMVGGPVGWIIAAALGVGALTASFVSASERLNGLRNAVNNFTETNKLVDGILVNSTSRIERALEFVYRKEYSINELYERRQEIAKQLYGVDTPEPATVQDVGTAIFQEWMKKFDAADTWNTNSHHPARSAANLANSYLEKYGMSIVEGTVEATSHDEFGVSGPNKKYVDGWALQMPDGTLFKYNNPDGWSDADDAVMYDVAAMMELFKGSYKDKVVDEYMTSLSRMFYGGESSEAIQGLLNKMAKEHNPDHMTGLITPGHWNTYWGEAEVWTGEDIAKSYLANKFLWEYMGFIRKSIGAAYNFRKLVESGKDITESDVVKTISAVDTRGLGAFLETYNSRNIAPWFYNAGYDFVSGQWQAKGASTSVDMANQAIGSMRDLLDTIKKIGLESSPATENLRLFANLMLTLAQAYVGTGTPVSGKSIADTKTVNGLKFTWNPLTKMWQYDSPKTGMRQLTPEQMGKALGSGKTVIGDTGGYTDGGGGGQSSASIGDYKNHYNKGNAAPKQVIVRIGNLMNVESIDLSNPNNAAVISNLKSELAQALVDVVHDFDETWHG